MITVERTSSLLPDGRKSALFHLVADGGIAVTIAELGATLMRIDAPDRDGRMDNVLLGFDTIAQYPAAGGSGGDACLGGSCGRVANRVAGARVLIDGETFALAGNDGPNQLHGGPDGFHRRLWHGEMLADGVRLTLDSPDGDQGWPGTLHAYVEMRLIASDTLAIHYRATTDRATHVNLVNHAYFNLDGEARGDILDHELAIAADRFLPIDTAALPIGERRLVADSPFDFRQSRTIRAAMRQRDEQLPADRGYNHCFILPASGLQWAARLSSATSGRWLTLATDQPGLQLYDGYALGRGEAGFADRAGLALEAQAWPDSPNRRDFPSTRLDPGDVYASELRFCLGVDR